MMKSEGKTYVSDTELATIDSRTTSISVKRISMEHSEADMDRKSDRKLVSFRLPEDLMQELRDRAESDSISVTELVCRLLRQGLQASVDDRITALEAEIRELRRLKQVNFSNISPAPFYALLPHSGYSSENDVETKQRIARLETRLEEVMSNVQQIGALPSYLAKLNTLIEEVQTSQAAIRSQPNKSQADVVYEEVEQPIADRATAQSTYSKKKPTSEPERSSEEVA